MFAAFRLFLAASLIGPLFVARCADSAPAQPAELTLEQRGDLYMARKMYREAVEVYQKALPQGKGFVISNKIGIAYHQMQDFRAAKKSYDRVAEAESQVRGGA